MPVSLNNKRNTRIVEDWTDHATRETKIRSKTTLLHYGKETCVIRYRNGAVDSVQINLCGFDTVTTRGKIELFCKRYLPFLLHVHRVKGVTHVTHYLLGPATSFTIDETGPYVVWVQDEHGNRRAA